MRNLFALSLCLVITPVQSPLQRPRDPWVFRSVLDQRPRMVSIALSSEMWVAYDATWCGLYKAWKGGVHFDGAVYTTVHGPQPTSEGTAYLQGRDGTAWSATSSDGKTSAVTPRWRGYLLQKGEVRLQYDLKLADGSVVRVEETPEIVRPEKLADDPTSLAPWLTKGLVGLRRTFTATGIPAGQTISIAIQAECVGYLMERLSNVEDREANFPDGSQGRSLSASVPLDAAAPRNELMLFFKPAPEPKSK
ncbi:MAG: hypothetical protein ABI054_13810 [Planctomycetota bacterium]